MVSVPRGAIVANGGKFKMSRRGRRKSSSTVRTPWLAAALLVGVGTLAYSNSFGGAFVMDDVDEIAANSAIRQLWPPSEAMFGGSGLARRPLPYYTFAVNYALHGLDVWGYHALNLAIHLAGGLALFGILRRTLRMPRRPPVGRRRG